MQGGLVGYFSLSSLSQYEHDANVKVKCCQIKCFETYTKHQNKNAPLQ